MGENPNSPPSTSAEEAVPLEPLVVSDADLVRRARERFGSVGAVLAGGMLGLDKFLHARVKPDSVQVSIQPGEPTDIDSAGITVPLDESGQRVARSSPGRVSARSGGRVVVKRRR